jgi:hypothetical protein
VLSADHARLGTCVYLPRAGRWRAGGEPAPRHPDRGGARGRRGRGFLFQRAGARRRDRDRRQHPRGSELRGGARHPPGRGATKDEALPGRLDPARKGNPRNLPIRPLEEPTAHAHRRGRHVRHGQRGDPGTHPARRAACLSERTSAATPTPSPAATAAPQPPRPDPRWALAVSYVAGTFLRDQGAQQGIGLELAHRWSRLYVGAHYAFLSGQDLHTDRTSP